MGNVQVVEYDKVAVLQIDHGVTNAVGPDLVDDLSNTLKAARASYGGLVLAGNQKFFSIGLNLPALIQFNRDEMEVFWQRFNALIFDIYTLPIPTAVAMEGHAIAAGTIFALAADFRLAAAGRNLMGLNEIKLGLPVPYLAMLMLNRVVDHPIVRDMIYHGEFVKTEKAYDMGLIDELVAPGKAVERAVQKLADIAQYPAHGFATMKGVQVDVIRKKFAQHHAEQQALFLDCWFSPGTQSLLRSAAEKF